MSWLLKNHKRGYSVFIVAARSLRYIQLSKQKLMSFHWAAECLGNMRQRRSSLKLVDAIYFHENIPLFRLLLADIRRLMVKVEDWQLCFTPPTCNHVASEISKSVTREHSYQSYILRNGPTWLREVLLRDAAAPP